MISLGFWIHQRVFLFVCFNRECPFKIVCLKFTCYDDPEPNALRSFPHPSCSFWYRRGPDICLWCFLGSVSLGFQLVWSSWEVLVGDSRVVVLQKLRNRTPIWSTQFRSEYLSRGNKTLTWKNVLNPMFLVVLFIIAKIGKQTESLDGWMDKEKAGYVYISTYTKDIYFNLHFPHKIFQHWLQLLSNRIQSSYRGL